MSTVNINGNQVSINFSNYRYQLDNEELRPFIYFEGFRYKIYRSVFDNIIPHNIYFLYPIPDYNYNYKIYFKKVAEKYNLPMDITNATYVNNIIQMIGWHKEDNKFPDDIPNFNLKDLRFKNRSISNNVDYIKKIIDKSSFNDTEEQAMEILEYTLSKKMNIKLFLGYIYSKFPNLISCIKTPKNQKIATKYLFGSSDINIINDTIKIFNIKVEKAFETAMKNKDPEFIWATYYNLTLSKKQEKWKDIIRLIPTLLFKENFTSKLTDELEKVQNIEWELFGPDPGVKTEYYSTFKLVNKINKSTPVESIKLIILKTCPNISKDFVKKYLRNVEEIDDNLFDLMEFFRTRFQENIDSEN